MSEKKKWFGPISNLEIRILFILQRLMPHDTILFQYKSLSSDFPKKESVDLYFPALDFAMEIDPLFTHMNKNDKDSEIALAYRENFKSYCRLRESRLAKLDGTRRENYAVGYFSYIDTEKQDEIRIQQFYKINKKNLGKHFDEDDFWEYVGVEMRDEFSIESTATPYEWALHVLRQIFMPDDQESSDKFSESFHLENKDIEKLIALADIAYDKLEDRKKNATVSDFINLAEKVRCFEDADSIQRLAAFPFWISKGDLELIGKSMPVPDLELVQDPSLKDLTATVAASKNYTAIYGRSWYYQRAKDAAGFRL